MGQQRATGRAKNMYNQHLSWGLDKGFELTAIGPKQIEQS